MRPQVVHCKRDKYDVYVGRPSKWGNPFAIGVDGTREEVIAKYRVYLLALIDGGKITAADLTELSGKTLACWCAPRPCHADVIADLVEEQTV